MDDVRRLLAKRPPVEAAPEPGAQPAAVAIILHEGSDGLAAVFIKRAVRPGDLRSGQIAFPGGRRQPADADLLATAHREAREAAALDPHTALPLQAPDDITPRDTTPLPAAFAPFHTA